MVASSDHESGTEREESTARWGLVFLLGLTLAIRLAIAAEPLGFLTGDDVEMLQAGWMLAGALEYTPWEIRSLFVPHLLVTPALLIGEQLTGEPRWLIFYSTVPFILIGIANIWLVYRLALRILPAEWSLVAASVYALHWLPAAYGTTPYPRTFSTSLILVAALVLSRQKHGKLASFLAGVAIAAAFTARYSEIIFFASVHLVVPRTSWTELARRSILAAAGFCAGTAVMVGWYDHQITGEAFSSLIEFSRYTLVEKDSSSLARSQSTGWYLKHLHEWIAPTALPLLYAARGRAPHMLLAAFIPVLLLSAVHHKELRYLQAATPFLCIAIAAGAASLSSRRPKLVAALLLLSVLWHLVGLRILEKRSIAAVRTTHSWSSNEHIAASQVWAYGHLLLMPKRATLLELGIPPQPEVVDVAMETADVISLYGSDVDGALHERLAASGFRFIGEFAGERSKRVRLYVRHDNDQREQDRTTSAPAAR